MKFWTELIRLIEFGLGLIGGCGFAGQSAGQTFITCGLCGTSLKSYIAMDFFKKKIGP